MSDTQDMLGGAEAVATLVPATQPVVSVFLHGLIRRPVDPILTTSDVEEPLVGPFLEDALRAALSRRIVTGSWS